MLLAVGIMLVGKADPALYERTRMAIADIATPVIGAMSSPVAASAEFIEEGKHLLAAYDENKVISIAKMYQERTSWHLRHPEMFKP